MTYTPSCSPFEPCRCHHGLNRHIAPRDTARIERGVAACKVALECQVVGEYMPITNTYGVDVVRDVFPNAERVVKEWSNDTLT